MKKRGGRGSSHLFCSYCLPGDLSGVNWEWGGEKIGKKNNVKCFFTFFSPELKGGKRAFKKHVISYDKCFQISRWHMLIRKVNQRGRSTVPYFCSAAWPSPCQHGNTRCWMCWRNVPELSTKLSTSAGLWDQDLTATARNRYKRRCFGIPGNWSPRLNSSRGKVVQ